MYTTQDLEKMISEVTTLFTADLAKAEDESKKKDESKAGKESDGESKKPMESEKPEDKGVKDQHQQDTSSKEGEGKMPESKEAQAEGEQAPTAGDPADESGYDAEDHSHMEQMYRGMNRGELKAHHDCIRKCMDSSMAKSEMEDGAKDAQGYRPNGGAKDGEAAATKTPAASDEQPMTKSEQGSEIALIKSEFEAFKAKSADEKKTLETALSNFLTKFVEKTAPAGKAIMSLDIIAKSADVSNEKPLTKSEIDGKLLAKSKELSLAKSDREAINSYYFSKNIETVRHLLK